jgi:glycosyltransferase involved in cell wall biosynthesis
MVSRRVARYADINIVNAPHLTTYLPAHVPVRTIPGGINLDLFHPALPLEPRKQLGLPLNKTLVLFAANPHNPVKRFHLAQAAVDLLRGKFDIELVVVADALHNMMPTHMNACDTLLLTSTHEGSPTVVKEALACNLPVVSVDVGDVRERIESVTGCFVCAESPQAIAEGLTQALSNPRPIRGRDSVMHLDEKNSVRQIIEVYHHVIDGTPDRGKVRV